MSTTTPMRRRLTGPMSRRLRTAREDADLTQRQLAELIGVHLKTVNNYENPRYAGARKSYVVRDWAEATSRDFEDLFGTSDRPLARSGWLRATAGLAAAS